MKVSRLTDKAVHEAIGSIIAAAQQWDADEQRQFLEELIKRFLEPLEEDDFFGTEGWEHWAGLDD